MVFSTIKRDFILLSLLSLFLTAQAQAPKGYYSSTKGLSGKALKTAFGKAISNYKTLGYDGLWDAYRSTDRRPDGKVWDVYSNTTNYNFGSDQDRGHHSKEGDTYNREHTIPQSWFGKKEPMRSDIFHVLPSDSYVNGIRSSYPLGETDHPSWTSNNGFSKKGESSTPGYSGTVFEPNDEFKGDIARGYFYMATRYESSYRSFSTNSVIAGNPYPFYKQWVINMMLRWAKEDPVSQKEIDRNNAAYKTQGNRNPYIDFPGLEQYIWGDKTSTTFDPDTYEGGNVNPEPNPNPNPQPGTVAAPTFNPAGGIVAQGTQVSISTTTQGATIHYTLNEGQEAVGQSPVKITVNAHTSISAYAMLNDQKSQTVTATYSIKEDIPAGDNVYALITGETSLVSGQTVLIVGEDKEGKTAAMGKFNDNHRKIVPVTVTGEKKIQTDINEEGKPFAFTATKEGNYWTFFNALENKYLSLQSSGNQLHISDDANNTGSQWNISFDDQNHAALQNVKYKDRFINYNAGANRFACYKTSSNQLPVFLYGLMTSTGIDQLNRQANGVVKVYTVNGLLVKTCHSAEEALQSLPAGFYIVNGQKILVK